MQPLSPCRCRLLPQKCVVPPGNTCDVVATDSRSRCKCCDSKDDWSDERWCTKNYNASHCSVLFVVEGCFSVWSLALVLLAARHGVGMSAAGLPAAANVPPLHSGRHPSLRAPQLGNLTHVSAHRTLHPPLLTVQSLCKPQPITCDKVARDTPSRCQCCKGRDDWSQEAWCRNNFDAQASGA